jgi:hypothetical protein
LEKICMLYFFFPSVMISTARRRCSGMKRLSVTGTENRIGAYTGQQDLSLH